MTFPYPPRTRSSGRDEAWRELAELAERQRTTAADVHLTSLPRTRRVGRAVWDAGSKTLDRIEIMVLYLINARHLPGRWLARLRLLAPTKTFNIWLLVTIAFATLLGLVRFLPHDDLPAFLQTSPDWRTGALVTVMNSLFTGSVVGILALLWNDLFVSPYLAARIRAQIRRRPNCVLLNNIGHRAVQLAPADDPITIVPRTELYDEITPGVLQRKRKDLQIVVGDPGVGKTTALIGIAGMLAKLGIVPVLVPLRSTTESVDLVELGKEHLKRQVNDYVRSEAQFDQLWRWLYKRRRVALLTDDLDRLAPDGERGFMIRKALKDADTVDLPIIATARSAAVPAGIAASAIDLGGLDEPRAVRSVAEGARNNPSFRASSEVSAESLTRWIKSGRLTEVPYYLELLAELAAAGKDTFPQLDEPWKGTVNIDQSGLTTCEPDGTTSWNPWWVHFFLVDHYCAQIESGSIARWKGIEAHDRRSTMRALEDAALGVLLAQAVSARAKALSREERERSMPERSTIEEFLPTDDRWQDEPKEQWEQPTRPRLSAHEVIDTAQVLRILDRDAENRPQFRHRITQAYLAGRRLAQIEGVRLSGSSAGDGGHVGRPGDDRMVQVPLDYQRPAEIDVARPATPSESGWMIDLLLDHRHPEKLTAHTALTFAALWADRERRNAAQESRVGPAFPRWKQGLPAPERWEAVSRNILEQLLHGADQSLDATADASANLDPRVSRDPAKRRDPDDALIKLTTAADIAHATALPDGDTDGPDHDTLTQRRVLRRIPQIAYVTRWTKLNAIKAIAALETSERWNRIWDFACDPDYVVRQAASIELERDAYNAYRSIQDEVQQLILDAAELSALGVNFDKRTPESDERIHGIAWPYKRLLRLRALGTVLPAIVSGLQEETPLSSRGDRNHENGQVTSGDRSQYSRQAREALDHLVALAFQGEHHNLEQKVAQGFRGDAMRHATGNVQPGRPLDRSHAGPGWVSAHERLVATVGLCRAEHWYTQLVLGQALSLYTIAGGSRQVGYDIFARCLHRRGPYGHPFTHMALRLARTAVRRHSAHSRRWQAYVWDDEIRGTNRRPSWLSNRSAQLLGDVTLLLDLSESAQADRIYASARMDELPYCLHTSRDRSEITRTGCPPECGWNLCPYKQAAADEPNEHRGVSRAFCRQQRWIARHHKPPWNRNISRRRLAAFWREMERRART